MKACAACHAITLPSNPDFAKCISRKYLALGHDAARPSHLHEIMRPFRSMKFSPLSLGRRPNGFLGLSLNDRNILSIPRDLIG